MSASAATRSRAPGILLGIGLGGFVDGIVLHQILQWHHMLTSQRSYPQSTVAGLETNTLADGLFHAASWILAVAGVVLLWRAGRTGRLGPARALIGWALVGWGIFNVVEGVVDHHLLGLHHVREETAHRLTYDIGFLVFGAILLLAGGFLAWRSDSE